MEGGYQDIYCKYCNSQNLRKKLGPSNVKFRSTSDNVAYLIRRIRGEHSKLLQNHDAGDLSIFATVTKIADNQIKQDPDVDVPLNDPQVHGTSKEVPLLVVQIWQRCNSVSYNCVINY